MNLESTLRVLNEMRDAAVIERYAIGGAVAAFLYIEPGTTFDLDIFILWEPGPSGLLNLGPIYKFLAARGCEPRRAGVMIAGWEVQFLPVGTPLESEALREAVDIEISSVPTRIFTQEHLMAISLRTGRPKDFARLVQFVEEGQHDAGRFAAILSRFALEEKWTSFRQRFLTAP